MQRLALVLAAAGLLAACGTAISASRSTPRPTPRRVLVLTQTRGYHHASIPGAARALRRVAASDGRYQLIFLRDAGQLTPGALKDAAGVVFLLTSGELPLSSGDKAALLAFVRRGGGLVGFHSATDTFHHWPQFISLIGAEFRSHALPSARRVVVEDRRSPATEGLGPSFEMFEEFYTFRHDPRPRVHVLARLDTGSGGPDRPLVWCRRVGRGRVFYDALGHFVQTWSDPRQLKLSSGGISWAVGVSRASDC